MQCTVLRMLYVFQLGTQEGVLQHVDMPLMFVWLLLNKKPPPYKLFVFVPVRSCADHLWRRQQLKRLDVLQQRTMALARTCPPYGKMHFVSIPTCSAVFCLTAVCCCRGPGLAECVAAEYIMTC